MYNSYEEYMQNVLGMNIPNTYMGAGANYGYEPRYNEVNMQEVNNMYPEIYGIVYPMIQKACSKIRIGQINENKVNEMVDEIYNNIEPGDDVIETRDNQSTNRNGDVKNPRVKEERRINKNYTLRDLIKILILRELFQGGGNNGNWGGPRPVMPRNARRIRRLWKTSYNESGIFWNVGKTI